MKTSKQFAYIASALLLFPSFIMLMFFILFSKFSLPDLKVIDNIYYKILVLYLGVIYGSVCLYTTYTYKKISRSTPLFYFFTSFFALLSIVTAESPFYIVYIGLICVLFLIAGFFGYNAWSNKNAVRRVRKEKTRRFSENQTHQVTNDYLKQVNENVNNQQTIIVNKEVKKSKVIPRKIEISPTGFTRREKKDESSKN